MTWPLGVTSSRSSGANTGRRASTVFHDGLRTGPVDSRGVAAWAQALAGAVRADVGAPDGIAAPRNDRDLPHVAGMVDVVTSQLPIRGGQLTTAVDRWSRIGQLYASARDLPPMNAMPENRVSAVIAGRHVPARGADLDRLRLTVGRTGGLSTGRLTCSAAPPGRARRLSGTWPTSTPGKCERLERPSACSPMRMLSLETSPGIDL